MTTIDLRQYVAGELGRPTVGGRTCVWPCPWCGAVGLIVTADAWRCAACKRAGDVVAWVRAREGVDEREARTRLALAGWL